MGRNLTLPFLVFWILVILCRKELGLKGVAICVFIWVGVYLGFTYTGWSPYIFVAAQSLMDAILILVLFGGDIYIR